MLNEELEAVYEEYQVDPAFRHFRKLGMNFVPGVGNSEGPAVMFLGEAPGRTEDRRQEPFCGQSGQLLWSACDKVWGAGRVDAWTTNVVKYRPTDERDGNRPPDADEIESSRPYLRRELRAVDPWVLVPLGGSALACIDYGASRGLLRRGEGVAVAGYWIFPTWHPSYVLRRGGLASAAGRDFLDHLMMIRRLAEQEMI